MQQLRLRLRTYTYRKAQYQTTMGTRSSLNLVLKVGLIIAFALLLPVLIIVTLFGALKPLATAILGGDIAKSGFFYFAVATLSLIIYLILIVFAMRFWEEFLRALFMKSFKYLRKETGRN
jgi:cytochrome c biogenesis factor